MEHAVCEDLLEAVLVLTEERGAPPSTGDIAARLAREPASIESQLMDMERAGKVRVDPPGKVVLLPAGKAIASRVVNRHRILESFLAEKLGVEPRTAAGEACLMEHQVSDETIRRLSEFLGHGEERHRHRGGGGGAGPGVAGAPAAPIPLSEYPEGTRLRVMAIGNFSRVRRLADVGLLPGESLVLKRRLSNGSVVVEVKGSDIALSSEVAATILVEEQG
ncbi:MAG TPA: metal-dependent transcriptional regulator [Methanomicrobiales archaeon]|nr:metal-dependent transcriptional regulator [Methanomicrobiales archaeon]